MPAHDSVDFKPKYWPWLVSGLLLLATMINYMDRQTLSNLSVRITNEFQLEERQYGDIEAVFGVSFAVGSLVFGWSADRFSVRLLYPLVLVGWSAVGFLTGLSQGYGSLLVCRALLGFFEAGHWPCALIVTQRVLSRSDRAMGNSLLQSGASLGAILTPQIIALMVPATAEPGSWRLPFFVIGGVGAVWAVAWLLVIGPGDLPSSQDLSEQKDLDKNLKNNNQNNQVPSVAATPKHWLIFLVFDRRFWALAMMVICINTSWQLVRAWLPKFLQQGRGYIERDAWNFNSLFFVATDVGCILAGVVVLWLARKGLSVHASRILVYLACSLLAALTTLAAALPQGYALLAVLLLVGAGLLGVFPCYYTLTQEMPKSIMGRMTGLLSCVGWLASAPTQSLFGAIVDKNKSYDQVMALVGWSPLVGLLLFWILWPRSTVEQVEQHDG